MLRPLDGQQRLTTLFLLHWYVASLADELDPDAALAALLLRDAADRARLHQPLSPSTRIRPMRRRPSAWITDQPWYVYPWRQDPTIASMLVMLDAIHERLAARQHGLRVRSGIGSRRRTTHDGDGAIWFLFLPVVDADLGEDLYIKMNSRGKPLTTFEVFKADFESIIEVCQTRRRHRHLVDSIDGSWADILWEYEKAERRRLQDRRRVRAVPDLHHRDLRMARRCPGPQVARQEPRAATVADREASAPRLRRPREPERRTKPRLLLPRLRHVGGHRSARRAGATVHRRRCRGGAAPAVLRDSRPVRCLHLQYGDGVLGTGDAAAVRCSARSAG